jgi:hypothetical protein
MAPILTDSLVHAKDKLQSYYEKTCVITNLAAVLDPRKKFTFFEKAWMANPEDVKELR